MKIAAGVIGLVFGLISITYVAFYGAMLGSVVGWFATSGSSTSEWADMVKMLSWLAPLCAIAGGAFCFKRPGWGSALLAASALCHYQLMGFGSIGNTFIFTPAVASLVALIAALSSTETLANVGPLATPSPPADGKPNSEINSASQQRANEPPSLVSTATPCFDRAKWNALALYDKEVSSFADQIRPLGQKWMDELASAYMTLGNNSYLPDIVAKIKEKAELERKELKEIEEALRRQKAQEQIEAAERAKTEMQSRAEKARISADRLAVLKDWFWGTAPRRIVTAVVAIGILVSVSVYPEWRKRSVSDPIVWTNPSTNCRNVDCLVADMQKSGATPAAIEFAKTLSAQRNNIPSWAIGIRRYGPVDLVIFDQSMGYYGGFAFINSERQIILPVLSNELFTANNPGFVLRDPRAFILRGGGFVEEKNNQNGGQRFIFASPIGDCEACQPLFDFEYAYDFDARGHLLGSSAVTLANVSDVQVAVAAPGH